MSLLNVWVSAERALVAVDSAVKIPSTNSYLEASKLVSLPHANLVMAVMGEVAFLGYVFYEIHHALSTIDYDVLADTLQLEIDSFYKQFRWQAKYAGAPLDAFRGCEIVIVGWSSRQRRILGMRLSLRPNAAAFVPSVIDPWCIMPAADWTADAPPPIHSSNLLRQAATKQVRWTQLHQPSAAIGGKLVVAEITAAAVKLTRHDFPY